MHGDALDREIDTVAGELTAAPVPSSVRAGVRRRIEPTPAASPLLSWAAAAAAVVVLASGAWLGTQAVQSRAPVAGGVSHAAKEAAAATSAGRTADVLLLPSPLATRAEDARRITATANAGARRLARAASLQPSTTPAAAVDAADGNGTQALLVDRLDVTALVPATVALDAVPLPMPLRIDRMDIEPLALP